MIRIRHEDNYIVVMMRPRNRPIFLAGYNWTFVSFSEFVKYNVPLARQSHGTMPLQRFLDLTIEKARVSELRLR